MSRITAFVGWKHQNASSEASPGLLRHVWCIATMLSHIHVQKLLLTRLLCESTLFVLGSQRPAAAHGMYHFRQAFCGFYGVCSDVALPGR